MSPLLAIALKDLRTFTRQRASLFFTFIWPVCVAVLFGVLFGGTRDTPRLPVAVVDEDNSAASKAFVDRLAARESFTAERATRDEALDAVRKGRRIAAIVLKPGFGDASSRMFYGAPPEIELVTDPGRRAERGMLEGLLMQQGAERLQALFDDPSASRGSVRRAREALRKAGSGARCPVPGCPELDTFLAQLDTFLATPDAATQSAGAGGGQGWSPLRITFADIDRERQEPRNGYDVAFPQAMLWAIFGCVMAFGTTFVSERVRGTLVRLQVSPATRTQVLAGKSLAAMLAIVIVQCMLLALGVVGFGVRPVSWVLLVPALVCTAAAFVGIILLLASMSRSEHGIGGMGPAVMMPLFMAGGAMVPLIFMPSWLASVGYLSPVRWAILALEGAIWRGFTARDMAGPCAILLAVAAVTFVIGTRRQDAD